MSIKIMGQIWDYDLPHNELLVMLAMADHADHTGDNIFPSVGRIAWKTNYSERQVQRTIKSLIKKGILIRVGKRDSGVIHYKIDLSKGTLKEEYKSVRQNVTSDKMSPLGCHGVTSGGDIAMSPESSLETSYNLKELVAHRSDSAEHDIPMPAFMQNKISLREEPVEYNGEESEENDIHPLIKSILYLCRSTGTTKLESSHMKKLQSEVRFIYKGEWVQYSPIMAWTQLPYFDKWIEDVLFTQLINQIPEQNGIRKISRTKVVDSIRNQMQNYSVWSENIKVKKTSKRFDDNCEKCKGKGYWYDDNWKRIECNCG